MAYDIFVSYHRADRELVAKAASRLEQRGVSVWYDVNIENGADWRETVADALTQSGMLAVFFSDACNESRQLKKELALADSLEKPVVPVLIEDARPRGAYLDLLADRNWIEALPDPAAKVEQLADLLAGLAGKGATATPVPANDVDPAPGAAARSAPARLSDAYVGRVGAQARKQPAPKRDILPFRWIDLLPLAIIGALGWWAWRHLTQRAQFDATSPLSAGFTLIALVLTAVGAYGAVAFPIRYYLRRRASLRALGRYLLSSGLVFVAVAACLVVASASAQSEAWPDLLQDLLLPFAILWAGFTAIAFLIYGILASRRAERAFRSNIRKI